MNKINNLPFEIKCKIYNYRKKICPECYLFHINIKSEFCSIKCKNYNILKISLIKMKSFVQQMNSFLMDQYIISLLLSSSMLFILEEKNILNKYFNISIIDFIGDIFYIFHFLILVPTLIIGSLSKFLRNST